jgi:hypothetical protein
MAARYRMFRNRDEMSEETITSKTWFPVVAAITVAVLAAAGIFAWIYTRPAVHAGQVLSVNIYPIHRELSTGPPNGARTEGVSGPPDIYDQLIVLAEVQIKNQTDIPLFLHDMSGVVHLQNDEEERSLAASQTDFAKAFIAYPDLKPLRKDPLPRDLTLTPGQQVEGMVIYNYPISKAQWDSRTGMDLTFSFLHQNPLVLHVPHS